MGETLDRATGRVLEEGRSPSRVVNELDNRGSHFSLALYWAEALASQHEDATIAARFRPVAEALAENEQTIGDELPLPGTDTRHTTFSVLDQVSG